MAEETDAELFRRARAELDMTQAEMAEALGYSGANKVSDIEGGRRAPSRQAVLLVRCLLRECGRSE